ncbi:unnamed protein product [Paramecium octaurelia]|uniref:non-specific serine/threonine protein kinase n=1 Tax=Paramecium octaurelia TaxID=43137 RepID=A0A8S1XLP2_PAROT|nr:unnamed protein product [Paramecium octaurelia]
MHNFFDSQYYEIETCLASKKQIVFLKVESNNFLRCQLLLENTILTLKKIGEETENLETINIANAYLEFNDHICMGRGVSIRQKNKELLIFGLTSLLKQTLKLYGIQKDFASQYKVLKQIGSGSFGKVYKVKSAQNEQLYAVKMFEKQLLLDPRDKSAILKEIQILRLMDHPNVLSIKECYESDQCIFLVEELFDKQMEISQENILKEEKAINLLLKLLNGLEYIHSKKIIHRDIKPNNILFRNFEDPVIADFGLADFYRTDGCYLFQKCGTRNYVAPEIIRCQYYDYKVDIYSLGVVFHQLLTAQIPHPWDNFKHSPDCQALLIGMLHSNPRERFSISEIMQNILVRRVLRRGQILDAMGSLSDIAKTNWSTSQVQTKPFQLYSV